MHVSRSGRARRIEPPGEIDAQDGRAPDYATSFAADLPDADTRTAEQWVRTILEGAPWFLRWFVLIGWKFVLRLRLAPSPTPGTVAGWTIKTTTRDVIMLDVESGSIAARKVLKVDPDRLTLTTYVWYERAQGRFLWSTLAPVHHRIEPLLLTIGTSRRRHA